MPSRSSTGSSNDRLASQLDALTLRKVPHASFLGVSAEIRDSIYRLLFTGLRVSVQKKLRVSEEQGLDQILWIHQVDDRNPKHETAILFTCTTIYGEARRVFYESIDYFLSDEASIPVLMDEPRFEFPRRHLKHVFNVAFEVFPEDSLRSSLAPTPLDITNLGTFIDSFPSLETLALDIGRVEFSHICYDDVTPDTEDELAEHIHDIVCPQFSLKDLLSTRPEFKMLVALEPYFIEEQDLASANDVFHRFSSAAIVDLTTERAWTAWKVERETPSHDLEPTYSPHDYPHWPYISDSTLQNLILNLDSRLYEESDSIPQHYKPGRVVLGQFM